jgi:hypothetical protein
MIRRVDRHSIQFLKSFEIVSSQSSPELILVPFALLWMVFLNGKWLPSGRSREIALLMYRLGLVMAIDGLTDHEYSPI